MKKEIAAQIFKAKDDWATDHFKKQARKFLKSFPTEVIKPFETEDFLKLEKELNKAKTNSSIKDYDYCIRQIRSCLRGINTASFPVDSLKKIYQDLMFLRKNYAVSVKPYEDPEYKDAWLISVGLPAFSLSTKDSAYEPNNIVVTYDKNSVKIEILIYQNKIVRTKAKLKKNHPHCEGGWRNNDNYHDICYGSAFNMIEQAEKSLSLLSLVTLVEGVLNSYNPEDAFIPLAEIGGYEKCDRCEVWMLSSEAEKDEDDYPICSDCNR